MARRGARGKGWIRLMRIIVWVLAVLMVATVFSVLLFR